MLNMLETVFRKILILFTVAVTCLCESVQVVKFFGIVSLPAYQICLSVLMALEEENSDSVYSMDLNNTLVLKASAMV